MRPNKLQGRSNKISDKQEEIEEKVHQVRSCKGTCNVKFRQGHLSKIASKGHGKVASLSMLSGAQWCFRSDDAIGLL